MKDLADSISTFEIMREHNYLYVDKTEYIWKMVRGFGKSYFLSRPRRFGKSLTVSTLKAVFEGKRHLFDGLAISQKDYDWKKYPVIHLSFGDLPASASDAEAMMGYFNTKLDMIAAQHSVVVTAEIPGMRLRQLIDELYKQGPVVVLVDEYDKPLIDNLQRPAAEAIRDELKSLLGVLKDANDKLRMVFVTGVTKFSHVSLFSGVNNLTDLTMKRDFATMLGYTQEELEENFAEYIDLACEETGLERSALLAKVKEWYDGYQFHEKEESVYNPVSVTSFFGNDGKFYNYWFATGTPTFLMKLIRHQKFDLLKALNHPVGQLDLEAFEIQNIDIMSLLFQTGYVTIRKVEWEGSGPSYYLDYPNREVKEAFNTYLLCEFTDHSLRNASSLLIYLRRAIIAGDAENFMEVMKTYFANIPYDIQIPEERYYQTVFYLLFLLLGVSIQAEVRTNSGRIDAVAAYGDKVFLFEFKINQPSSIALEQIQEREYFQKYQHSGKNLVLVGATFDTATRQLKEWTISPLNKR